MENAWGISCCERDKFMVYTSIYKSILGNITLASDEIGITGLWLEGQKYFAHSLPSKIISGDNASISKAKKWLDIYFAGQQPEFLPPLHMMGTPFRQRVWQILLDIPYGETITYGEIARILAKEQGDCPMSAQAVGNAVGHNEISIVIPCHRVVGAKGNLVGYAGGIERKIALLKLEQVDMSKLYMPRNNIVG